MTPAPTLPPCWLPVSTEMLSFISDWMHRYSESVADIVTHAPCSSHHAMRLGGGRGGVRVEGIWEHKTMSWNDRIESTRWQTRRQKEGGGNARRAHTHTHTRVLKPWKSGVSHADQNVKEKYRRCKIQALKNGESENKSQSKKQKQTKPSSHAGAFKCVCVCCVHVRACVCKGNRQPWFMESKSDVRRSTPVSPDAQATKSAHP